MTSRERMIRTYDKALVSRGYRQYFDDSGFYNFGLWDRQPSSQREASEALIDELVSLIGHEGGRILDVACGPGASTQRLCRTYEPRNVTAINISDAQLSSARERAPGCTFIRMDAAHLDFPAESFDAVMCVEAAFHFDTRQTFLSGAARVLKPGGTLVMTDMLFRGFMKPIGNFGQVPPANFMRDLDEYRRRMANAGFVNIDVRDATRACLGGFRRHLSHWPAEERRKQQMSLGQSLVAGVVSRSIARYFAAVCKTYVIAAATKPSRAAAQAMRAA
ncbi:methyltransferase domain-containing protein [Rhodomicrobium sp. Az07]|uniref:class I SAM-dependent methyltransferase n=1 Tax=Rhodomicrobium sp. Az07 TaxID=2839034 RepID=UPI001BE53955|nr:class I SAM-dependent methyltransferase [Rhodomicrobium sp. Az07]MBT3069483.1 methyltransferase domain-containing protein [Rhodomicrobium sp. Az07]